MAADSYADGCPFSNDAVSIRLLEVPVLEQEVSVSH